MSSPADSRGTDGGASLDLGIGGSRSPAHLKCLHAHVAFALARPGYELGERMLAEVVDPWPRERCCSEAFRRRRLICRLVSADVESARLEWELAYRDVAAVARDPVLEERLRVSARRDHDGAPATSRRHVHASRARRRSTRAPMAGRTTCSSEQARPGVAPHAGVGRGRGVPPLRAWGRGLRSRDDARATESRDGPRA